MNRAILRKHAHDGFPMAIPQFADRLLQQRVVGMPAFIGIEQSTRTFDCFNKPARKVPVGCSQGPLGEDAGGRVIAKPPKARSSPRTIDLPDVSIEALVELRQRQGDASYDGPWCFQLRRAALNIRAI
jgi:hypothetical protein